MTQHQPCHRGVGTQWRPVGGNAAPPPPPASASAVECGEGKVTKAKSALNLLDGEYAPGAAAPEREGPALGEKQPEVGGGVKRQFLNLPPHRRLVPPGCRARTAWRGNRTGGVHPPVCL